MSINRETVIWESPDGTYKMGAYAYSYINFDSPDFDEEWDVEYDFDKFNLCLSSSTAQKCIQKYSSIEGNAGIYEVLENLPENKNLINHLEKLFNNYNNTEKIETIMRKQK